MWSNRLGSARKCFDEAALEYDEARPSYPDQLIQDVIDLSRIPKRGSILEIGCGTGQATIQFARRGYTMLCLDIGKRLTLIAKKKCQNYPLARIINTSFEKWKPAIAAFDLLISATAFHWIPPEIGYPKAAQVLKQSGYIALFWNTHPTPYTGFFEDVQMIYAGFSPELLRQAKSPTEIMVQEQEKQLQQSGLFETVQVKNYSWSKTYTTEEYLRLLDTFSDHGMLEAERRNQLYAEIGKLLDTKYDGKVERPYQSILLIAKKKATNQEPA